MAQKRTSEEIELIRPAFMSNGKPGIFENIVLGRRERKGDVVINVTDLKQRYTELGCLGTVKLIEFLESEEGKEGTQIGSGTIDFSDDDHEEYFRKVFTGEKPLLSLYIGNPNINVTPLQWLTYLAEGLGDVIPEQIKAFDYICYELAMVITSGSTPFPPDWI